MKKIISVTQEHPMVALASDITYMQKSFWCGCSAYPLKLSFMRARHRCTGKKCLVRAVAPQEHTLCIIAPCIYISAALDKLGKQHHILENIHA